MTGASRSVLRNSAHLVFASIMMACSSTGTWKSSSFSGRAPDPTIVAPLDCVSNMVRDRETERDGSVLARAVEQRVGAGGAYHVGANDAVCQELGAARWAPFGPMPDSHDAIVELASATHAASVLVPVLQRSQACRAATLAIRDAQGGRVGSIDTGGTVCDGYPIEFRMFLFDGRGELLWSSYSTMTYSMGRGPDPDAVRAKVDELFAQVPATLVAKHHDEVAVASMPMAPGVRPMVAMELPANAPKACAATWHTCETIPNLMALECRQFVIHTVRYSGAQAGSTCTMYDTQLKQVTTQAAARSSR